jgi:hypothetical protein
MHAECETNNGSSSTHLDGIGENFVSLCNYGCNKTFTASTASPASAVKKLRGVGNEWKMRLFWCGMGDRTVKGTGQGEKM